MDLNSLVYTHRENTGDRLAFRDWVEETINRGGFMAAIQQSIG